VTFISTPMPCLSSSSPSPCPWHIHTLSVVCSTSTVFPQWTCTSYAMLTQLPTVSALSGGKAKLIVLWRTCCLLAGRGAWCNHLSLSRRSALTAERSGRDAPSGRYCREREGGTFSCMGREAVERQGLSTVFDVLFHCTFRIMSRLHMHSHLPLLLLLLLLLLFLLLLLTCSHYSRAGIVVSRRTQFMENRPEVAFL